MNIRSIQMSQLSPAIYRQSDRSVEVKSVSSESSAPAKSQEVPSQNVLAHIDYFGEQLNEILTKYPPFFPLGSYQRIDLIRKIKGFQEEIEKSSLPADIKKTIMGQKLSDNASDAEIGTAIQGIMNVKDEASRNISAVRDAAQQGSILDIRI